MSTFKSKQRAVYDVLSRMVLFQTVNFYYTKNDIENSLQCDYLSVDGVEQYHFHYSSGKSSTTRQTLHKAVSYIATNIPDDFHVGNISDIIYQNKREFLHMNDGGRVFGGSLVQYDLIYSDIITGVLKAFKHLMSLFFVRK